MPEAAVKEDSQPRTDEGDVWASRQLQMLPITPDPRMP